MNKKTFTEANRLECIRSMLETEIVYRLGVKPRTEHEISSFALAAPFMSTSIFYAVWNKMILKGRIEMVGAHYCPNEDAEVPFYIAYDDERISFDEWCQENLKRAVEASK